MEEKRVWLYDLRKKRGMTHQDVADKSGIHRAYYTEIENGRRRPRPEIAQKIGKILGFKWTLFFENKSNETKQKIG